MKDSRGIGYLAPLLAQPGREIHALDLVAMQVGGRAGRGGSDAGALLDPVAKEAYRRRLEDLRDELAEAESFGDAERAARAEGEITFLAHELAGAVGLGGRDRRAASDAERARQAVSKASELPCPPRGAEPCAGRAPEGQPPHRRLLFYEPVVPTRWEVWTG